MRNISESLKVISLIGEAVTNLPPLTSRHLRNFRSLQILFVNEGEEAQRRLNGKFSWQENFDFVCKELFPDGQPAIGNLIKNLMLFWCKNPYSIVYPCDPKIFQHPLERLIDIFIDNYQGFSVPALNKGAILYADMEGYSIKVQRNEPYAIFNVLCYFQIFMREILRYNGQGRIEGGDSILAIFPTTQGAMEAARKIFTTLRAINENVVDNIDKVNVRIGLSWGTVFSDSLGRPFLSHAINLAQRVSERGGKGPNVRAYYDRTAEGRLKKCTQRTKKTGIWATDKFYREINKSDHFYKAPLWSYLVNGKLSRFWQAKNSYLSRK